MTLQTNKHLDYIYKYVVIGEAGVGKTSIARQFIFNDYSNRYNTTIGVDFSCKTLSVRDKNIKIQIWDTAGQESFRSIISSYYKDTVGVIIVVDNYDNKSLETIKYWQQEYYKKQKYNQHVFFMVLINKIDLFSESLNYNLIKDYCTDNNIIFYGVSAKTGCNINESFRYLTTHIYRKTKDLPDKIKGIKRGSIELEKPERSYYYYSCCNIV
jgi:Ras-related protein Rab-2A